MTETVLAVPRKPTLKCFCCDAEMTHDEAVKVDRALERLPEEKFDFLIANLGLRAVTAGESYFHDKYNVNVCERCLAHVLKLF